MLANQIEIPEDVVVTQDEINQHFSKSGAVGRPAAAVMPSGGGEGLGRREIAQFEYEIRDLKIELSKR